MTERKRPNVQFLLKTREEMDAAHAAHEAKRRPAASSSPAPLPRNAGAVLDLGNMIYFTFRGRAYGIPPLGWRAGMRLTLLWTEALRYPTPLTADTGPRYYAVIQELPPLLWSLVRPVGRIRRVLKALRLLRNPFLEMTEGELVELAHFFLSRRLISTIGPPPATMTQGPRTSSRSSRPLPGPFPDGSARTVTQ